MFGKLKIYIIFLIFLLMPLFSTTSNVRKRRRPSIDVDGIDGNDQQTGQTAIPDQIAIAAESNYQNAIQYEPAEHIPKRNYRQGKLMIEYMNSDEQKTDDNQKYTSNVEQQQQEQQQQFSGSDIINVGDTETAQEYVQKALQMHQNSQNIDTHHQNSDIINESINPDINTIPTSSPRYDVFPSKNSEYQDIVTNPNYDQVTRTYDVYDYNVDNYDDKQNFPKPNLYQYERIKNPYNNLHKISSSPLTASAAIQIPKDEIRKHIENAVSKYMKEMEADGKIINTSQTQKIYYKYPDNHHQQQSIETNNKPYISSTLQHNSNPIGRTSSTSLTKQNLPGSSKQQSRKEQIYQPGNPLQDNINQNVEFIYKMKTRQPTSTTLKQQTKPSLLGKGSATSLSTTNFDHSTAMKNFQDFDISHVVNHDNHHQHHHNRQSNKQKLLFNSDVYHDINSLPYKSEKHHITEPSNLSDYHGYGLIEQDVSSSYNQYIGLGDNIANSEQSVTNSDSTSTTNTNNNNNESIDAGYPIMNPYQYVLNKEKKYSETSLSNSDLSWAPSSHLHGQNKENNKKIQSNIKTLEHDSYSPKFNNNPEGYGYQHNYKYKTIEPLHYVTTTTKHPNRYIKRGKRGGGGGGGVTIHSVNGGNNNINYMKKSNRGIVNNKDIEANTALRPPPKM